MQINFTEHNSQNRINLVFNQGSPKINDTMPIIGELKRAFEPEAPDFKLNVIESGGGQIVSVQFPTDVATSFHADKAVASISRWYGVEKDAITLSLMTTVS